MSQDILNTSLDNLPIPQVLRGDAKRAGFATLAEVILEDADTLINKRNFSLHAITELINFLEVHGKLHLFKE